ncbi:MAG: 30S ribosomal protein S3, partial [Burkholderiales bacterium]
RQTLRADIDYAENRAYCTYGVVGIKVWIYKGDLNLTRNKFIKLGSGEEDRRSKRTRDFPAGKKAGAQKKSTPRKRKVGTEDVAAE